MSGPGDPPEGTPEGASGGGEDEFRSVVFDESFVRAARIQEFSARERQDDAARPVRVRHALPGGLARQAAALILLIVLAFGFAIYMGVRHPYTAHDGGSGEPLRVSVVPLVPTGTVRAVSPADPFAGTQAAGFGRGVDGLALPADVHGVGGYTADEVMAGYETAQQFLGDTGLRKQTVTGGDIRLVQDLLEPRQAELFADSLSAPAADGVHEVTGWLVRFDTDRRSGVSLVGDDIRVQGSFAAAESAGGLLQIVADHTYVYAVRAAADPDGPVSLFTVRRRLTFHYDHDQLRQGHVEVVQADVTAGPLACGAQVQSSFLPILAGRSAPGGVSPADPYDHDRPPGAVCAPLADPATAAAPQAGPRPDPTSTPGLASPAVAPRWPEPSRSL